MTVETDSAGTPVKVTDTLSRLSYQVIVVLPVYNEEENIGRLLDRIDEHLSESLLPYQIVGVDDGSKDDTFNVRQPPPAWISSFCWLRALAISILIRRRFGQQCQVAS